MRYRARDAAYGAVGIAVIAICSWIAVPSTISFTLQIFAVFAVAGILGTRLGTLAMTGYLLLGVLGAPVFAGFRGGAGALLEPTGGFLISFLFIPAIVGGLARALPWPRWRLPIAMAVALLFCYGCGTAQFLLWCGRNGKVMSVWGALSLCVIPYLVPDALKIVLALIVTKRVVKRIPGLSSYHLV